YNVFCNERREFILSKLIIRSGTFVAEDIKDAKNAQSEDVFIHQLSMVQKECNETCYWFELLCRAGYINDKEFGSIYNECIVLSKIIRSIFSLQTN
ncbi:MAG: four helix bundle protein, partial [Bacteroidales bacterium]|nr:four helix bundle protein [Bacteroidales bacterium]